MISRLIVPTSGIDELVSAGIVAMEEHERGGRHSADGAMPAAEGKPGNRSKMQGDDPSRTGLDSALSSAPPQPPSVAAKHQNDFSPYFLAAAAAAAASAQAEAAARSSGSTLSSTSAPHLRPYIGSRSPFPMSSTGSQAFNESPEGTSRSRTSRKNVDRVRCCKTREKALQSSSSIK